MAEMTQSSGAYAGRGTMGPVGANLDPAMSPVVTGGTRLYAFLLAVEQLNQLQSNLNLATNYYNLNHQDFTFWVSTYQSRMGSALSEGMARPFYAAGTFLPQYGQLDYLASFGRGQSRAQLKMDKEWFGTRRRVGRYNTGQAHRVDLKFALARLNGELEGWNLGYRYEDNRKMQYDEQRHAHQAEILNLGIGAGNAARQGLATAVRGLSEAKTQKAGQYGALSNGLSTFSSFEASMRDTRQDRDKHAGAQYQLATAGKNPGISGGIPDVTQQQQDRAAGAV
jgi:hypothetical protein